MSIPAPPFNPTPRPGEQSMDLAVIAFVAVIVVGFGLIASMLFRAYELDANMRAEKRLSEARVCAQARVDVASRVCEDR